MKGIAYGRAHTRARATPRTLDGTGSFAALLPVAGTPTRPSLVTGFFRDEVSRGERDEAVHGHADVAAALHRRGDPVVTAAKVRDPGGDASHGRPVVDRQDVEVDLRHAACACALPIGTR
jgi:hypothetical protein